MLKIEGKKYLAIRTTLTYNYRKDIISIRYDCDRKKGYIFEATKTEEISKKFTKEIIRSSFSQILKDKKLIGFEPSVEENIEELYSCYTIIFNIILEDPENNNWGWRDDILHYGERHLTRTLWVDIE